jgi:hypothetical protein
MALADVVVIELPAQHESEARGAVESCTRVLGPGRCREASEPGPSPTWRAVVHWDDAEWLNARIQIEHQPETLSEPSVQQITFTASDSLTQRYQALGLVIVSHVVAASAARERAVPKAPPPPQPEPVPMPEPAPIWGVDLAAAAGPGVESDALRLGGLLRGWFGPWTLPVRPTVALGWATASGSADATWFEAAAGVALPIPVAGSVALELHAEAVFQRVTLTATRGTASERGGLPRYGGRAGLGVFLEVTPGFEVFTEARAAAFNQPYRVDVQNRPAGEEGTVTGDALLGVRVSR